MLTVDAHLHIWDPAVARYTWLDDWVAADPDTRVLHRRFDFDEVLPRLGEAGIDCAVLVQSLDADEDTDHLLAVARDTPQVIGVVAWLPLDDAGRAALRLAELSSHEKFVGVRSLIHDRADPDWILGPAADAGLSLLEASAVPFDYVTSGPAALAHLPKIAERHPGLPLVLDHLGKPPIGGLPSERVRWRLLLSEAAENPLLTAKVSGLYPRSGDREALGPETVRPFVEDAIEIFGAERLMYGGDWPVAELAGGYARVAASLLPVLDQLPAGDRAAILGGNAVRIYGLRP